MSKIILGQPENIKIETIKIYYIGTIIIYAILFGIIALVSVCLMGLEKTIIGVIGLIFVFYWQRHDNKARKQRMEERNIK